MRGRRGRVSLGLGAVALGGSVVGIPWLPIWGFYGLLVCGFVGVVVGADVLDELGEIRLRRRR